MATRKKTPKRAQVQPTAGAKWAFGQVLRGARQGKGISQEQLAQAAGLDRSFLSLVERGIQSPNVVILLKIADVLGVSASELVATVEAKLKSR